MTSPARARVAILGGGMGGLAAAWRLSEPGWREQFDRITVYQRGVRLGGKAASSRGANGRIEEHGLHIWLGYYDNSFRMLREAYEELDRRRQRPGCPITSIDDAFTPSVRVGLFDDGPNWAPWMGDFARNQLVPGDPAANVGSFTPADIVRRSLQLLLDFFASIDEHEAPVLSMTASPRAPRAPGRTPDGVARTFVGLAIEAGRLVDEVARSLAPGVRSNPLVASLLRVAEQIVGQLTRIAVDAASADPPTRRMWHLVSVVAAQTRGIIAEGLLTDPSRIRALNGEDYREWTLRHGAHPDAADSTLIRGLYDLVFGFRDGDPEQPGFGAGLGIFLSAKTFFDYKGAVFWKMAAGMGDVVIAPLYEALCARGVEFEFLTRVDRLRVDAAGTAIEAIDLTRQADVVGGPASYRPLVDAGGLPCFNREVLVDQLVDAPAAGTDGEIYESHWWPDGGGRREVLRRGVDFDAVVFALPPAMAKHVASDLAAVSHPWREMVDGIGTVATEALQLWLRPDEAELGWDVPGSTTTGYSPPFDTWASMPQLVAHEQWPVDDQPGTIAYFCSVLDERECLPDDDIDAAGHAHRAVERHALEFVGHRMGPLLPASVDASGAFRWELLCGAGAAEGEARLGSQYWRANVDPSDRYVQSLPGTDHLRLRPDGSGVENLVLAGDWTDNGLNAGCIEAAVLSGLQAANALTGRSRLDGVLGVWLDSWDQRTP